MHTRSLHARYCFAVVQYNFHRINRWCNATLNFALLAPTLYGEQSMKGRHRKNACLINELIVISTSFQCLFFFVVLFCYFIDHTLYQLNEILMSKNIRTVQEMLKKILYARQREELSQQLCSRRKTESNWTKPCWSFCWDCFFFTCFVFESLLHRKLTQADA